MSNTIHNTKVTFIKNEVFDLIKELSLMRYVHKPKRNHNDQDDVNVVYLKNKYKNLSSTSPTLFNLILSEATKNSFDKTAFNNKINEMLDLITNIQSSKISQDDASEKVGVMLANEFIPRHIREPNNA